MAELKRATVYLDAHVHRLLKIRAAELGITLSALVNDAAKRTLAGADSPTPATLSSWLEGNSKRPPGTVAKEEIDRSLAEDRAGWE